MNNNFTNISTGKMKSYFNGIEIKACSCGSEYISVWLDEFCGLFYARCEACNSRTHTFDTKKEAVEAWNRRRFPDE